MQSAPDGSADRAKLRSLQTAESIAMLTHPLVNDPTTDYVDPSPATMPPVTLQISLRRARLALLVAVVVAALVPLTLLLFHGTELERFDRRDVNISEQEKLLDRYNSYSGSVASAVGRPIELFVTLMAQVLVLWFMTESVLTVESKLRVKVAALAFGAGLGVLLTNGLNALNVQVRELPVTMVLSMSDLSAVTTTTTESATAESTFSEISPRNPSNNTILRNLILPRATRQVKCQDDGNLIEEDVISYGMPQRTWMKDLIPEALPASTIRIDLKTNSTPNSTSEFPMDASMAADIILMGVATNTDYSEFNTTTLFVSGDDSLKWYPVPEGKDTRLAPTARLAGLLPPDPNSTETQDREWFLTHSAKYLRAATSKSWQNASRLVSWTMDVSRVNITSSIWVDAITIESEVFFKGSVPKDTIINGSRYDEFMSNSASSPTERPIQLYDDYPDARVHAFAVCNDTATLHTALGRGRSLSQSGLICGEKASTSFHVFSSGRRLVADALHLGMKINNSELIQAGNSTRVDPSYAVTKNLRVVYSTTYARISWQPQNLSEIYGAECRADGGDCMGLDVPLLGSKQQLLVSAKALPIALLSNIGYRASNSSSLQLPLEIVTVKRPSSVVGSFGYSTDSYNWHGDVLLRHNIRDKSIRGDETSSSCSLALDLRLQAYINNHMYMETTLQPTYTAAVLFLMQNGVAKDVTPTGESTDAASRSPLQLDGNVQEMSVRLSIPKINAILTLAGCAALVVALFLALFRSCLTAHDGHQTVSSPHQIARVMVDDATFPSQLLERRVVLKDGEGPVEGDAGEFCIDGLSVGPLNAKAEETSDASVAV